MKLGHKLGRLERRHEVLNPCPVCGNGGIVTLLLEPHQQYDHSMLVCGACGLKSRYSVVVQLSEPAPAAMIARCA